MRNPLLVLLLLASPLSAQLVVSGTTFEDVTITTVADTSISDCDDVTGLHAWWDATAGITEDVGVTTWADQKNSYDWVQVTDADEPTLTATCQNSLDCIQFGATDYMSQAGAAEFFDFANNDYTFVVVANNMTDNNDDTWIEHDGTSSDRRWWAIGGGRQYYAAVGGTVRVISAGFSADTTNIIAWRWDLSATLLESFVNGSIVPYYSATQTPGTVEDGTVLLGTNFEKTYFGDKKVMEICIFLADVTDDDLDAVMDALNAKWSAF